MCEKEVLRYHLRLFVFYTSTHNFTSTSAASFALLLLLLLLLLLVVVVVVVIIIFTLPLPLPSEIAPHARSLAASLCGASFYVCFITCCVSIPSPFPCYCSPSPSSYLLWSALSAAAAASPLHRCVSLFHFLSRTPCVCVRVCVSLDLAISVILHLFSCCFAVLHLPPLHLLSPISTHFRLHFVNQTNNAQCNQDPSRFSRSRSLSFPLSFAPLFVRVHDNCLCHALAFWVGYTKRQLSSCKRKQQVDLLRFSLSCDYTRRSGIYIA